MFNRPTICTHLVPTFAGTIDMIILLATEASLRVWYVSSDFTTLKGNVYFLALPQIVAASRFQCYTQCNLFLNLYLASTFVFIIFTHSWNCLIHYLCSPSTMEPNRWRRNQAGLCPVPPCSGIYTSNIMCRWCNGG